jgi:hypothetical protein
MRGDAVNWSLMPWLRRRKWYVLILSVLVLTAFATMWLQPVSLLGNAYNQIRLGMNMGPAAAIGSLVNKKSPAGFQAGCISPRRSLASPARRSVIHAALYYSDRASRRNAWHASANDHCCTTLWRPNNAKCRTVVLHRGHVTPSRLDSVRIEPCEAPWRETHWSDSQRIRLPTGMIGRTGTSRYSGAPR